MNKGILFGGVAFLAIAVLAIGAGAFFFLNNDDEDSNSSNSNSNTLNESNFLSEDRIQELSDSGCELFTIADATEYAGDSVSSDDITEFDFLGCNYSWDKADIEEIVQRNLDASLESGFEISDLEDTENRIAITFLSDFVYYDTKEEVENAFRGATNQLTEEESQQVSDALDDLLDDALEETSQLEEGDIAGDIAENTLDNIVDSIQQVEYETFDGPGDLTAWADSTNELVFAYGNLIISLEVSLDNESMNRDNAIKIANTIIDKI